MSIPTPQTSLTGVSASNTPAGMSGSIPALGSISIQDLESGKLNLDSLILEVLQLKLKISELRYEMCHYLEILSSIDENTVPLAVYQEVANQLSVLKNTCDAYFNSYKRLLPIIRYSKLKNGINPDDSIKIVRHEVPIDLRLLQDQSSKGAPQSASGRSSANTPNSTAGRKNVARGGRRRNSKKIQ
ncbi:DEKNAAC105543 [Brettanomyces naardenensis]|uniref:DEKNAAC105543 n=1 Tax=Brettanomyces naardenensis TaxID=13370 RepID=A0A448YU42_BRENA|nr:DEKNAAC105543 [Brettanomyces naardenensis]